MFQSKAFVLSIIVIVFISGGLLYIYNPTPVEYKNKKVEQKTCTQEAMLCPDGSYVGRAGPDCEFTCPSEVLCEGEICPKSKLSTSTEMQSE